MFKKSQIAFVFVSLFCLAFNADVRAQNDAQTEAARTKADIVKIIDGKGARVKIDLRDDKKLKGYISEIKDSGFVLINKKTGASREISYLQVRQVKSDNSKLGLRVLSVVVVVGLLGLFSYGAAQGS